MREVKVSAADSGLHYWKEVWRYRDLLYILSWRDVKVRYKQTLIGAAWAVIRPLLTMLIFVFVFGKVAGLETQTTIPYPIVVLAGVLAWQLLSTSVSQSAASLLGNERLITKVYFPRVLIPASTIATCVLDFTIAIVLLLLALLFYGYWPAWTLVLLPLWMIIVLLLALGFGLGLAALNVSYRDFRYALPFLIQLGLYVSPVGFTTKNIPAAYQLLYQLNPAVGIIDSFRYLVIGPELMPFPTQSFAISTFIAIVVFILGFSYFKKVERNFADVI